MTFDRNLPCLVAFRLCWFTTSTPTAESYGLNVKNLTINTPALRIIAVASWPARQLSENRILGFYSSEAAPYVGDEWPSFIRADSQELQFSSLTSYM